MIIIGPSISASGRITTVSESASSDILAVASAFPLLVNPPARAAYSGQALRHRVALHRRGEAIPFSTIDSVRLPINHVAFHPSAPVVVIGAGSYDGGWMFEGDLLIWNWETDEAYRPFKQIPEVIRCNFSSSGDRIEAEVRPWDEEWDAVGEAPCDNAFERAYPANAAYSVSVASDPIDLELNPAARITLPPYDQESPTNEELRSDLGSQLERWFGTKISERKAIWDVAWLSSDRIGAVHDDCLLEICEISSGERVQHVGEGYGAAILRSEPVLVHGNVQSIDWRSGSSPKSSLLALVDGSLKEVGSFEGSYCFSSSRDGRLLGRLDRSRGEPEHQSDLLISPIGQSVSKVQLGHYDCFNHFIGIDGAPFLFMLQGTPPSSHERKYLCLVREDETVERLWPILPYDGSHASHAMECCGCYITDRDGEGVIVAGCHYDPNPSASKQGFIYRKPLHADREIWRLPTTAAASAIVYLPKHGLIAAAFLDGALIVLDAASGRTRASGRCTVHGIDTVIFSMDALDDALVLGTFTGEIAIVTVEELLGQNPFAKRLEIG